MSDNDVTLDEAPPKLLDFHQERIRVLHFTWIAFFMTFYVWFNLAPLATTMRAARTGSPRSTSRCC